MKNLHIRWFLLLLMLAAILCPLGLLAVIDQYTTPVLALTAAPALLALVLGLPLLRHFKRNEERQKGLTKALSLLEKNDLRRFEKQFSKQEPQDNLERSIASLAKRIESDQRLKEQFHRIVAPELLEAMLRTGEIHLGGERIRGALLFMDIRGFTAIAQRRDPEQVVEILNTFFSEAVPIIERVGGIVDKFVGDGLLALFGIPSSLGNNALCAIQAAMELQQLARRLNEHKVYGDDVQVQIGIGVAKGNVIAGTIGAPHRLNYTAVGATVNLAARLCSIAKRGEIVCCNFSHLDVDPFVSTERTAPILLKGIDVPIYTYRIKGWKSGKPSARHFSTPESMTKVVKTSVRKKTGLEPVENVDSKQLASRVTKRISDKVRDHISTRRHVITEPDHVTTHLSDDIIVATPNKGTRELANLVEDTKRATDSTHKDGPTESIDREDIEQQRPQSGGVLSALGRTDSAQLRPLSNEEIAEIGKKEAERSKAAKENRKHTEELKKDNSEQEKISPKDLDTDAFKRSDVDASSRRQKKTPTQEHPKR